MTVRYAVVFAPRAERQLNELYAYIAEHGSEAQAEHYVGQLVATCEGLQTFPERGTKRDDIRPHLRTMGYKRRVTIAFAVDATAQTVTIHGVFYGGQDFERHLDESDV